MTDTIQALEHLLRRWESQENRQLALRWTPLVLALLLALLAGLALLLRLLGWDAGRLAVGCAGVLALGLALLWAGLALRRRPSLSLARRFDARFGLQERLSTALELADGRLETLPSLHTAQVQDALARAQAVPGSAFAWRAVRWPRWQAAAPFVAALVLGLALVLPLAEASTSPDPLLASALEQGRQALQEALQTTLRQPDLDEPQRENLLRALQARLDELQEARSSEEAFAALQAAAADLEAAAQEEAAQQARAAAARAEALRQLQEALQAEQEAASLAEALRQAQATLQEAGQPNAELAEALRRASSELQDSQPSLSEALQEAAQASETGQQQAVQEALEQAAQEAESAQGQEQASREALEQAAQQAREAARQVAEGESAPSSAGQPNDSAQGGASSPQGQEGGQQGQESGQQAAGAQGGQAQQPSSPDETLGQASSENAPSNPQGSDLPSQEAVPEASNAESAQGEGGSPQNAEAGAGGRESFAPIYAPQDFAPQAEDSVALPSQDQEGRLLEGDFAQNPEGELSIPYNQVFSAYEQVARQALEAQGLPPNLQPLVRAYFEGLRP